MPDVAFDVWSFEVKAPGRWDVVGVHEASAHGRFVHRPFVVLLSASEELDDDTTVTLNLCLSEATRLGVGLIVAYPDYNLDSWDFLAFPDRHSPTPETVELQLEDLLLSEAQSELARWRQ